MNGFSLLLLVHEVCKGGRASTLCSLVTFVPRLLAATSEHRQAGQTGLFSFRLPPPPRRSHRCVTTSRHPLLVCGFCDRARPSHQLPPYRRSRLRWRRHRIPSTTHHCLHTPRRAPSHLALSKHGGTLHTRAPPQQLQGEEHIQARRASPSP